MCEEIDNVALWRGKGRSTAKINITEQSCCVVTSCLFFDPQIFKRRIITFIMDFSDLQFILEKHLIKLFAACAQSMGKILSKTLHLTALPFEIHQQLNCHSKSNYLFILAFLNNNYDQIKAFLLISPPFIECLFLVKIFCISRCLRYPKVRFNLNLFLNPVIKR